MAPPSFPSVDIFFSAAAPDPSPTQLGGPSSALPQHHHRLESAVAPIHLQSSLDPTASCSTACLSRQTGVALPPVMCRRQRPHAMRPAAGDNRRCPVSGLHRIIVHLGRSRFHWSLGGDAQMKRSSSVKTIYHRLVQRCRSMIPNYLEYCSNLL
jgi:hypothetical protein